MDPLSSALLTDLYELTMLEAYFEEGMDDVAVFELFVRKLPEERNFLIAAGLEQVLDYLEGLRFTAAEIAWMRESGRFGDAFLDQLAQLRFTGDVHAMAEGTVVFADEPLVRVTAPLPQAQLVESRLMNLVHLQTLIASKAARCRLAAPDRLLVDFGLRRAHGAEAGLLAARAAWIGGFGGTATVLAGARYGVPIYGTMAHSYVQAHAEESDAFERFARAHPDNVVLLIDTYDTEAGARRVVALAPRLRAAGITVKAVRIDSGDLGAQARAVRAILDSGGCPEIGIFASSSLDEHELRALVAAGAPISGFGVGTHLTTSSDRPYLDCAYKLEEYAGRPRRKRSEGKATWPGRKQVWRQHDRRGVMRRDVLTVEGDSQAGTPLIVQVMAAGRRLKPAERLADIRDRALAGLAALPAGLRRVDARVDYPVEVAPALRALAAEVDRSVAG
jgi:nicotinate phosphoribosyltransferase